MNTIKPFRLLYILLAILLISCNRNEETKQKEKELELKQKELELKEREISLQEKKVEKQSVPQNNKKEVKQKKSKSRELQYLYHANGGMIGYFDDGTIVGCPQCDFCRSSILEMFNLDPMGTYEVQSDGSLLVNKSEREFPNFKDDNGWALINYKWNEKVPQH